MGVFYRPTYLYFPNRTVIEKWMEETTNPMRFMQSAFPEAAGVPNTLRSNHACLILMPPKNKKTYIHVCMYDVCIHVFLGGGIRVRHRVLREVLGTRAACESWLDEHHRVCSLLHPFFNHRPIRKVKVRRPVKDPYTIDSVTCVVKTSWIFSLAPSPRMTFAHPPRGGRACQGGSAVILVLDRIQVPTG